MGDVAAESTPALPLREAAPAIPFVEGYAPFDVPSAGKPCRTYYRVYGDLTVRTPLVVLHGGPGGGHEYMLSHTDLHAADGAPPRPLVFYDQLGCGRSTRLPERAGDAAFWAPSLFVRELEGLLAHLRIGAFALLGHSWGAMLAAEVAARRPSGLRALVLACGHAEMRARDVARLEWVRGMGEEDQEIVGRHVESMDARAREYGAVVDRFFRAHMCRLDPWPPEVRRMFAEQDRAVLLTMMGPITFKCTGSLRDWSVVSRLDQIAVPTLLLNGRYDIARDPSLRPFFDRIPRVKWYTFAESAHMPHWEERERYMELVSQFLADV